jgi:hypothetical protein
LNRYIYGIGHALIKRVDIIIGGQLMDRHYSDWLNIWSELNCQSGHRVGFDEMVGNQPENFSGGRLYIPLQFWFNRMPGLALPLVALYNQEVKLNFEISNNAELVYNGTTYGVAPDITGDDFIKIYADYIFLDTAERTLFSSAILLEYLIEQVQFIGDDNVYGSNNAGYSTTRFSRTSLNFKHAVKSLIWIFHKNEIVAYNNVFNFSNDGAHVFNSGSVLLGGVTYQSVRTADYYLLEQNYGANNIVPRFQSPWYQYIYSFNFGLHNNTFQPSGYCNFNSISDASLDLTYPTLTSDWTLKIYAVNYNVLQVINGTAGLLLA